MKFFNIAKPFIFSLPPETAHNAAIALLKNNLIPKQPRITNSNLSSVVAGITFPNPVGLAAGFDKNAAALNNLQYQNFGFLEAGTVTPLAQSGNPKPRLFRLNHHNAIINAMGFNNYGKEAFRKNFINNAQNRTIPFGINIGKNKNSVSYYNDYLELLEYFYDIADYLTINISSPNTPNLRDIQNKNILDNFLGKIAEKNLALQKKYQHKKSPPIFLKISPDLSATELRDICDLSLKYKIAALIISNTTITRPNNINSNAKGGLSGAPLLTLSNNILRDTYQYTKGKIPLIGVGGISSASDAYQKISLGASLVQIYSSLIFKGFDIATTINKNLVLLLKKQGHSNLKSAIGCNI